MHAVAVLVASAVHAHTAGVPVLMWRHTIAPAAVRHRHVAASAELTQDIVLAVADALHAHRAGAATLRPAGWQPLAVEELAMVVTKKVARTMGIAKSAELEAAVIKEITLLMRF